jgi:Nucleoside-diphosphate-sugar epimerases
MRVLVTGVSGLLGKWITRDLMKSGFEPVIFTREPVEDDEFKGLQQIPGNINDLQTCVESMKGQNFGAIIHLAAVKISTDAIGSDSWKDYETCGLTMKTNIMGLYNMLQGALRNDIGIFIQAGSNSATGHDMPRISKTDFPIRYLPIDEEHPVDVENSYGYTKYVGEILLDSYARAYGIQCYAVRAGWNLDEAMRKQWAIDSDGPVLSLFELFNPWVAFEDCSMAHIYILEKAIKGELPLFSSYYCHADDTLALEPTMDIIRKFRPDLLLRLKSTLPGYAPFMSNQKLKNHTGWAPKYTWREFVK